MGFWCSGRPFLKASASASAIFSFLYLKKSKFQKYISVSKNFENIPQSPTQEATGSVCNFFFQFTNRSLAGGVRVQGGQPPPPGDRGACRSPSGDWGCLSPPPLGRPGVPPLYKPLTPISSSFEPKNSTKKSEKKRGVRRREAAKPCRIPHL